MSGSGAGGSNLGAPVVVGKQRNADATIFVGELDTAVNEETLWELFLQVGPVVYVHIPKDKVTNQHSGFGFVEFPTELDAEYASRVMNGVKLYSKPIRINRANSQRKAAAASLDVGANLFVGSLSGEVDERMLYDTFSRFGVIVSTPKIMRDPESGESKGFAFVSFSDFESADAAIAALNGQYVAGRPISVAYAIKKDSKGERHGSDAERLLASQRRIQQTAANAAAMSAVPRPMMSMAYGAPPSMAMAGGRPMMMMGQMAPPPSLQMPPMPPPPLHMQQQQWAQPQWGARPQ